MRHKAPLPKFILFVILTFWLPGNSVSMPTASAQQIEKKSLNQIAETFVGKWVGEGISPDGEKFKTELVFEWTLNQNFIQAQNFIITDEKRSLYALGFYGWQPVLKQIVFWSFDNSGTINEGVAQWQENSLKHEWRSFGSNGEIKDWRSILIYKGENTAAFTLTDGQTGESVTINYKRQKK